MPFREAANVCNEPEALGNAVIAVGRLSPLEPAEGGVVAPFKIAFLKLGNGSGVHYLIPALQ